MRSSVAESRDRLVVGETRKVSKKRCQRNVYLTDIPRGSHNESQMISERIEQAIRILKELKEWGTSGEMGEEMRTHGRMAEVRGDEFFLPIGLTLTESGGDCSGFRLKIRQNVWNFPFTNDDGDHRRAYDEAIKKKEAVSKAPM